MSATLYYPHKLHSKLIAWHEKVNLIVLKYYIYVHVVEIINEI